MSIDNKTYYRRYLNDVSSTLFSDANITLQEVKGEDTFASERPCIIDRTSIAIVSGIDIYTLPSYVVSIKRITYKGWKIFPMPHRDLRRSYLSGKQGGRPYWYVFNNIGQAQIKLFPIPQENITQDNTYINLWGANILSLFIVEFYRTSDNTDAANRFVIPLFMRRRFLKTYIINRIFQQEGRGVNLKAVKYWRNQYDFRKNLYSELLDNLTNKPRNLVANNQSMRPWGFTPPPPILPVNKYGFGVDDITG